MDGAACGSEVDELVQAVPILAAELADSPGGGCGRERHEQRPRGEPGDDEAALCDVGLEDIQIEVHVERDIRGQMQRGIKESEETEQAAEFNEPAQARREVAQRGNRKREDE